MTKNNIITNSHKINILKQNFTIPIAPIAIGGITKESQKLSLYSTKIYIKHTKVPSVLNISLSAFSIFDICVIYIKM
jgi:hypothetical protein